ncbi:PDZ and LIM domain protein 3 isoform X11 [Diorhabda carinulata]|uniref:PDZ and LIM domain protein 3 isoform X6 n=1 Tax=Diorhabda sublineata TaxID=1163346 RepID=UPI0024E0AB7A|nr:PDZ and LIM domain protein 3 isoform X6 [Diorhabda sublineata]XP_057651136.1 PDZ and LIM domain protein 3 isoform X11 [Diorhabda carinulata]
MSYQRPSFWHYRADNNKKKVGFGSPVDGVLHRGDIISKVGNYDSRDIRHQDAQNLFKNAGNNIRVVVQREVAPRSTGSSRTSSHNYSPLSVSPHLSPKGYTSSSGYSPAGSALTPYYSSPLTPIDNNYFEANEYGTTRREDDDQKDIHVTQQVASSVLDRISTGDPNKQLVHKQFNSPINLYSEPNVVDTIQKQTGLKPQVRRQVKFNPSESETYKALQEEELGDNIQEVTVPPQSKVYAPNKTIPGKKPTLVVNQNPQYGNALGNDPDVIQQSGSFKRLMWSVLPGSQF